MRLEHVTFCLAALLVVPACASDTQGGSSSTTSSVASADEPMRECRSDVDCPMHFRCTVEQGPGCDKPLGCIGECIVDRRVPCGEKLCDDGLVCCNASCGICTAPGEGCTEQLCIPKGTVPCGPVDCEVGGVCCDSQRGLCADHGVSCFELPTTGPTLE
jgi:hypothetical protein